MMGREEISKRIVELSDDIKLLHSVSQNPVPINEVFEEDINKIISKIKLEFNSLITDVQGYMNLTKIDENTENGRIMKLFDVLRSKELNNLYYNNNIVEARALEYEIREVFDLVVVGDLNNETCQKFFNKYKDIYDVTLSKREVVEPKEEKVQQTEEVEEEKTIEIEENKNRYTFYIVGPLEQKLIKEGVDKETHIIKIKRKLIKTFDNFIKQGMKTFITGANRGFEHIAIECLKELKSIHPQIELVIVLPYRDYTIHWNNTDKANLNSDIRFASKVLYLDEDNSSKLNAISDILINRNKFILDNSYCGLVCKYNGMTGIVNDFYKEALTRSGKIFELNPFTLKLGTAK